MFYLALCAILLCAALYPVCPWCMYYQPVRYLLGFHSDCHSVSALYVGFSAICGFRHP